MPEYIMLFNFTQQGVGKIKQSLDRIKKVRHLYQKAGARIKNIYAVLGQYDVIWVVEAPDDETIARLSLQTSAMGNVRTETMRAFNQTQYEKIVNKIKKN